MDELIVVCLDANEKKQIQDAAEKKNQALSQFCLNIILNKLKQKEIS